MEETCGNLPTLSSQDVHLENGTLDWTQEKGAHDSGVAGGRNVPVFKNEDSCFHTYVHVRLCESAFYVYMHVHVHVYTTGAEIITNFLLRSV